MKTGKRRHPRSSGMVADKSGKSCFYFHDMSQISAMVGDYSQICTVWDIGDFRAEKRSAQFVCAYPFADASKLKTLPFDSVVLLSSGFCAKNTFYHLRFVQFHQICYKIGPCILPTPCKDRNENGLAVQVPVHDYKHSKGTLLS